MSMLDSFFNKGFKAAKCKTLLKLTVPRIKLLRNRREIQLKQMRRDIAKLLETGQEATARIRVEHIIREENMMAAQEILELFCELIAVRLPIIEAQRECPLDLKEAISSVCFAAPRCADLPELLQVQIAFASKYGKEFVSAATELMPDCGVNRQIIELLSVRAPSPEKKIKLLKEIAEEHELDWDPQASETEFLKPHEDLLNGPTQFVSGAALPLPKEKHDETLNSATDHNHHEQTDSETGFESLDFPEVPRVPLRPVSNAASAPEIATPVPDALRPEIDRDLSNHSETSEHLSPEPHLEHKNVIEEKSVGTVDEMPSVVGSTKEEKQFVPFISPPSLSSVSFSARPSSSPPSISRTKSDASVDLQDVLAAAQAAAETAERAAAAARSAATLAQARISELTKKNCDKLLESGDDNPFYTDTDKSPVAENPHFDHRQSFNDLASVSYHLHSNQISEDQPDFPSFDKFKVDYDSPPTDDRVEQGPSHHQPQRIPSMDEEPYFSYPNLFTREKSSLGSGGESSTDNSRSKGEL